MTFAQSVKTCLAKYFTLKGRASRSEYWWFTLLVTALTVVVLISVEYMEANRFDMGQNVMTTAITLISSVLLLAFIIPAITVSVRRFHDRNISGWAYLGMLIASFIPVVGGLVSLAIWGMCAFKGTSGANEYGPDPLQLNDAEIFA